MTPVQILVGMNTAAALGVTCAMVVGTAIVFRMLEEQARLIAHPQRIGDVDVAHA